MNLFWCAFTVFKLVWSIFSSVSSPSFDTYPFCIFKVSHVLQYNNVVHWQQTIPEFTLLVQKGW